MYNIIALIYIRLIHIYINSIYIYIYILLLIFTTWIWERRLADSATLLGALLSTTEWSTFCYCFFLQFLTTKWPENDLQAVHHCWVPFGRDALEGKKRQYKSVHSVVQRSVPPPGALWPQFHLWPRGAECALNACDVGSVRVCTFVPV